jgi:peptidyl-prolyl cis-trans isomerase A (cyclophilin A)/peptidyl-prolyl cis-trans isomerase B (cyclophilin B)
VGLFYFAGHGVQVRGKNYLLPIAAQIQKESDVEIEGVEADWVLSQMEEARNRLNMVILDACRNNPLPRSVRSANRGLAPMNAPAGTLVAFATAPGTVASDGTGRNGLYTRHLMAQMTRPGLTIEQVFKRVRESVRKESGGIQVPEELNKLVGEDFYLVAASAPAAPADAGIRPDDEIVLWEAIKDGSRREDFEEYLRQYPNGRFVALANSRLKSAQPGRTKPADAGLAPSAPGINQVAMKTSQGTIVLELYPDKAPKTVANFLDYVKTGHYQGTVFHRVINNFMIQGGGYDPQLRQLPTRPPIENESGNGLKNEAFTIAMARTANPHSATAQFFINLKDNAFLNHAPPQQWGYTVFGRVVLGRDVVERIGRLPTGGRGPFPTDVPRQDVVIEGVTTGPTN